VIKIKVVHSEREGYFCLFKMVLDDDLKDTDYNYVHKQ